MIRRPGPDTFESMHQVHTVKASRGGAHGIHTRREITASHLDPYPQAGVIERPSPALVTFLVKSPRGDIT